MVRIVSVQGEVLIDDRQQNYMEPARAGMMLSMQGDCLVVTNNMSSAQVEIDGKTIQLGPQSCLYLRPDGRTWWDKHGLAYGGDARLFVGQVWDWVVKKTGGLPRSEGGGNATIGVRG